MTLPKYTKITARIPASLRLEVDREWLRRRESGDRVSINEILTQAIAEYIARRREGRAGK